MLETGKSLSSKSNIVPFFEKIPVEILLLYYTKDLFQST